MNLFGLSEIASALIVVGTFFGGCVGLFVKLRPRWRKAWARVGAALDTIAGRPPITDSITGREIQPALPSIGVRMELVEVASIETRQAINHIATLLEVQRELTQRVDGHDDHLERTDEEIRQLKEQVIERIAGKAEAVAAWRAVEAVAKHNDPTLPEIED